MLFNQPNVLHHSRSEYIFRLRDGDKILALCNKPEKWNGKAICVMFHGLIGHAESRYMRRIAAKMNQEGVFTFRINYRSCGKATGLSKKLYHAGQSDDIFDVLTEVRRLYPDSKMCSIGFSLGGNLLLKMAAENPQNSINLTKILAISPPVDMVSASETIAKRGKFFSWFFAQKLRRFVQKVERSQADVPVTVFPKISGMREFDEFYTAPAFGFKNALDYYNKSGCIDLLSRIDDDATILIADDDPVVDHRVLTGCNLSERVEIHVTRGGGHVGFFGRSRCKKRGLFWMDEFVLRWYRNFQQNSKEHS